MKFYLCLLLFVGVSAAASAAALPVHCGTVQMPPAQFNHTPNFNPIIHLVDYWEIDRICAGMNARAGRSGRFEGCERGHEVWLPKEGSGVSLEFQQCAWIHARAHLNGWAWDHPGAVYW